MHVQVGVELLRFTQESYERHALLMKAAVGELQNRQTEWGFDDGSDSPCRPG